MFTSLSVTAAHLAEFSCVIDSKPYIFRNVQHWQLDWNLTDRHRLTGHVTGDINSITGPNWSFHDWELAYMPDTLSCLRLKYNNPHVTSTDIYRIFHKDFYGENGLSLIYQCESPLLTVAIAEKVPIKNGVPGLAFYLQRELDLLNLNCKISGAWYDSGNKWTEIANQKWDFVRNWGHIVTTEAEIISDSVTFGIGYGYQQRHYTQQQLDRLCSDHAAVIYGSYTGELLSLDSSLLHIGPDFDWPLTKTKPYQNNRKGYESQVKLSYQQWKLNLNYKQLTNFERSRDYLTGNVLVEYSQDKKTAYVQAHWQPNQRVIIGFKQQGFNLEWRADLPQIKLIYSLANHELRLTSSSLNLHRIEYRYKGPFFFNLVYKFESKTNRQFYFIGTRFEGNKHWLEINFGESDNGQLTAKFDHDPSLKVSWGWSW